MESQRDEGKLLDLQTSLNKLQAEAKYLKCQDATKHKEQDVCTLHMNAKLSEVEELRVKIDQYSCAGKHFTKEYRTLEGHCGKFQTDLDKIDVSHRDDLQQMKKSALLQLNTMIHTLTKKVHSNGIVCPDCEVKK